MTFKGTPTIFRESLASNRKLCSWECREVSAPTNMPLALVRPAREAIAQATPSLSARPIALPLAQARQAVVDPWNILAVAALVNL